MIIIIIIIFFFWVLLCFISFVGFCYGLRIADRFAVCLLCSDEMRDAECGMWDAGCGMREAGCGIQDAGCGMRDAGSGKRDAGSGAGYKSHIEIYTLNFPILLLFKEKQFENSITQVLHNFFCSTKLV